MTENTRSIFFKLSILPKVFLNFKILAIEVIFVTEI